MLLRNGTILALTTCGVLGVVLAASEDRQAGWILAGLGCFLLAYVYAQITRVR